jgi:hypothetical protein
MAAQKFQDQLGQPVRFLDVQVMPHTFYDFPLRASNGMVDLLGQMDGRKDVLFSGNNQKGKIGRAHV